MAETIAEHEDVIRSANGVPTWKLVVSFLLVVSSAVTYAFMFFAGEAFEELFVGFGAELPLVTKIALSMSGYIWLLLLFVLVPFVRLWNGRKAASTNDSRLFSYVIAGFVLSVALLFFFQIGVYMPILKMGSVT